MNAIQLKLARTALGLGVREAAELSGVSHFTIVSVEADRGVKPSTRAKVRAALEAAGVIFIEENGEGPGVRLRKDLTAPCTSGLTNRRPSGVKLTEPAGWHLRLTVPFV